jgi:ATP-dependent protease ClpP protease subunit
MKKALFLIFLVFLSACDCKAETILLTPENTVNLYGTFSPMNMKYTLKDLLEKRLKNDNILYLVINSRGGDIVSGMKFINAVKTLQNIKVLTLYGASMGFVATQALPFERLVTESSTLMSHRAAGMFGGQFNDGEMEQRLNYWKSRISSIEKKIAKRLKMPLRTYKKKVKDEWWEYGENIVKKGLADRIVGVRCSKELMMQKIERPTSSLFGTVAAEQIHACPLFNF